jgi:proteic killer suppression protein
VEVRFSSEKLKVALSTHRLLQKDWGQEGAKKIALRLQQLAAVPTLADMRNLPGRCHELTGDRAGHLAVDVHQPYRLLFQPTADPAPRKPDGGLDWTQVDSITVTEIVDYH